MPKPSSKSIDKKYKKTSKKYNQEEDQLEISKKIKKGEAKPFNKTKDEKSPKKRETSNTKGKNNKTNKLKTEPKEDERLLRSRSKSNKKENLNIAQRKKNSKNKNIEEKGKEEKDNEIDDKILLKERIKKRDSKSLSNSKQKSKQKKIINKKEIIKDTEEIDINVEKENKMEEEPEDLINKEKETEIENEEIKEKESKSKIKSIEKLKKTINSKNVKSNKSNINISKKFELNEKVEKKERNNSEEKKIKSSSSNKNKNKKITSRKIKDISITFNAEDSSSNLDENTIHKKLDDYLYNSFDSQRISREVEEVINGVERKKNKKKFNNLSNKKRKRTPIKKKVEKSTKGGNNTSEEYNFILQKNPDAKDIIPFIDLEDLSKQTIINYTDILLAILEICQNSNSYLFAYSTKSKMFWNDVLQYKILKKIFREFKAETLRKYWNELSKYEAENIYDLIKKNKEYLDSTPSMKLGKIVSTVSKIFSGKMTDFQDSPNEENDVNDINEVNNADEKEESLKKEKKIYKIKNVNNYLRKTMEKNRKKDLNEYHLSSIEFEGVYNKNTKLKDYRKTLEKIIEEEDNKMDDIEDLKDIKEDNKNKKINLNKINQEDKFIFKSIDMILEGLSKEFSSYSKEYILDILQQNSMNIAKTYICLKEPMKSKIIGYTPLDDKIILKMAKGEEFNNLLREKGKKSILEREEYLSN